MLYIAEWKRREREKWRYGEKRERGDGRDGRRNGEVVSHKPYHGDRRGS